MMRVLPIRLVSSPWPSRSEEHTSELQSPCNLGCRLLLEKRFKENYEQRTATSGLDSVHNECWRSNTSGAVAVVADVRLPCAFFLRDRPPPLPAPLPCPSYVQ